MKFFYTLVLLFGQNIFAQTTINVSPLIIGKAYFCSYPSDYRFSKLYSEQTGQFTQNPYYTFRAKKISLRPSIDLGVKIEVGLKNNKHKIGFSWATDATGTMSKTTSFVSTNTYGTAAEPYKTYGNHTSYFQTSFVYNRLSLEYIGKIKEKINWIDFYVGPEVSIIFGKQNSQSWVYKIDTNSINSTYFKNDAKSIEETINSRYFGNTSVLVGFGLKFDIKTIKRRIDLFSLQISYRQGFSNIAWSGHKNIIVDSGKTFAISNELVAKGSGLYIQLSRNFQIYPWKSKKKAHNIK